MGAKDPGKECHFSRWGVFSLRLASADFLCVELKLDEWPTFSTDFSRLLCSIGVGRTCVDFWTLIITQHKLSTTSEPLWTADCLPEPH